MHVSFDILCRKAPKNAKLTLRIHFLEVAVIAKTLKSLRFQGFSVVRVQITDLIIQAANRHFIQKAAKMQR